MPVLAVDCHIGLARALQTVHGQIRGRGAQVQVGLVETEDEIPGVGGQLALEGRGDTDLRLVRGELEAKGHIAGLPGRDPAGGDGQVREAKRAARRAILVGHAAIFEEKALEQIVKRGLAGIRLHDHLVVVQIELLDGQGLPVGAAVRRPDEGQVQAVQPDGVGFKGAAQQGAQPHPDDRAVQAHERLPGKARHSVQAGLAQFDAEPREIAQMDGAFHVQGEARGLLDQVFDLGPEHVGIDRQAQAHRPQDQQDHERGKTEKKLFSPYHGTSLS